MIETELLKRIMEEISLGKEPCISLFVSHQQLDIEIDEDGMPRFSNYSPYSSINRRS